MPSSPSFPYQQRQSAEEKRNDLRALVGPVDLAPWKEMSAFQEEMAEGRTALVDADNDLFESRHKTLRGIREIQEVELKLSRGREYESRSSIFGSFTLGENYAPLVSILRYNCRVCNSGEDHRTARSASNARGRELWQPPKGQGSKRRNTVERGINVGRTVRKVERRARASREPGVWLRLSSGTRQGSEARNVRRPACSKIDDSKSGELNRATTEEAEHGGSRRSFPVVGDITPQRLGRKGNVAPVPPNQHQFREG
ncbi:hypothetical protein B0H14DRAFT_2610531 [Mycena olivaceomarginata]|nr:hypothetical protein B0H14DRAFT_2610531 [Mycena olivaceomarginata]